MIKGLRSYLKFSKLFGTGFLISCFILLGSFVSANWSDGLKVLPAGSYSKSPFDSSIDSAVYSRGMLGSNSIGFTKRIYTFTNQDRDKAYVFWNNNRMYMYYYYYGDNVMMQGHTSNFSLCDSFDSTGYVDLVNCASYSFDSAGYEIASNMLNSFKSSDYYAVGKGYYTVYYRIYYLTICFNSSEYSKSICFSTSHGLDSSLNLDSNLSFVSVGNDLIMDPPGWSSAGDNIQGGSNSVENSSLTGNLLYSTCTNGFLLGQLDKQLGGQWRYTCNAGINDTGVILDQQSMITLNNIPGQGVDFKTVYSLTKEGLSRGDWFSKYSTTYNQWFYNQNVYSSNPFFGKNAVLFSYFKILNDYGYNDYIYAYDILNGCKLLYYSDWNSEYNGTYFSNLCSNMVGSQNGGSSGGGSYSTGEVGSVDSNGEVLPPGYNNGGSTSNGGNYSSSSGVVIGADWSGITSGNDQKSYDTTTFINDYFQKLKSNYLKPYNSATGGTLPVYIATFLCAIVLFRFLSH